MHIYFPCVNLNWNYQYFDISGLFWHIQFVYQLKINEFRRALQTILIHVMFYILILIARVFKSLNDNKSLVLERAILLHKVYSSWTRQRKRYIQPNNFDCLFSICFRISFASDMKKRSKKFGHIQNHFCSRGIKFWKPIIIQIQQKFDLALTNEKNRYTVRSKDERASCAHGRVREIVIALENFVVFR